VNNSPLSFERALALEHSQDNITIAFTGIYFRNPSGLKYEYRLGASENWSSPTADRSVTYAKLASGEYRFEVRAIGEDGVRSETPAILAFTIASPFWKKWWFIFGMNVLVIGILWLGYKYRTNQLLKIERLRTRISADLHDEIASNLSIIATFSQIIEQENQPTVPLKPHHQNLLARISTLSQESVQSIRDIIWAIDPKTETLESLLTRLRDTTLVSCRANNIILHFDVPTNGTFPPNDLPIEVRNNLWLLAKEAIHNAIKHSQCKGIRCTYSLDGSLFHLNIEDDGKGFDASKATMGKGMKTMEMRARQLNGSVEIYRLESGGTGVKASVNLK
jgi:two-component sensor histidine kinase